MSLQNRWMGKKFHQWIEKKIVQAKGWEWWESNRACDFPMLQKYAQQNKLKCPEYEYQVLNDLRAHGLDAYHQIIYLNRFIADIAIPESRTILELNGPYHEHKLQQASDEQRKELFMLFGFRYIEWKMPISRDEYERKLEYFVKAHVKFLKGFPLRPICRLSALEPISTTGLIQKALNLKKRGANGKIGVGQKS